MLVSLQQPALITIVTMSRVFAGADLRPALDAVLATGSYNGKSKPSIGCNIKWHPGSEPDWYGTQQVQK